MFRKNIPAFVAFLTLLIIYTVVFLQDVLPKPYLIQLIGFSTGLFILVFALTIFLSSAKPSANKSLVVFVLASMLFTVVYFIVFIAFYLHYHIFQKPELFLLLGNFVAFKTALVVQLMRIG